MIRVHHDETKRIYHLNTNNTLTVEHKTHGAPEDGPQEHYLFFTYDSGEALVTVTLDVDEAREADHVLRDFIADCEHQ